MVEYFLKRYLYFKGGITMNSITFFFGQDFDKPFDETEKNFLKTPTGLFATNKHIDIPQDILYKNIEDVLKKVTKIFEQPSIEKSKFEIDEIELSLNIGADGKVSIIAIEGNASMNTSIKIKLKRK